MFNFLSEMLPVVNQLMATQLKDANCIYIALNFLGDIYAFYICCCVFSRFCGRSDEHLPERSCVSALNVRTLKFYSTINSYVARDSSSRCTSSELHSCLKNYKSVSYTPVTFFRWYQLKVSYFLRDLFLWTSLTAIHFLKPCYKLIKKSFLPLRHMRMELKLQQTEDCSGV
jgi:hypothetical protein